MKKMNTGQWVERALGQCFPQMTWVGRTSLRRWHVSREVKGVRKSTKTWGKNILGRKNSKHQVLTFESVTTVQGMRRNRKVGLE